YLMVRTPHKLQKPIGAPARQVPAAVHPAPRSTKPVRYKALPRQTPAPNIPPPNPSTRNVKLPNNPNRNSLQTTIQYINPRVPDRTAKRRCLRVIVIESHDRGPDRSLCRSVEIRDLTPEPAQGKGELVREGLAADQHRETPQSFDAVRGERMPECGCALKDCAAGLLDRSCKRRRILDGLSRGDGETGTIDEGEEQFESCNVEADGRDGHEPIMPVKENLLLHRQEDVAQATMGDGDALGGSGRAGGVDDVGEVVRLQHSGGGGGGVRRGRPRPLGQLPTPRGPRR